MCFYLVEKVSSIEKRLDAMIGQIDLLLLKLSENNSESEVLINPIKDMIDDKTQEASGVNNRLPK